MQTELSYGFRVPDDIPAFKKPTGRVRKGQILKWLCPIADLTGTKESKIQHLTEASLYGKLDRKGWVG
ncbi:hypothetical protein [Hymenobacter volaticus]|uniref:Uncharacterized protein n=1 Tax=Hymenobacter volaticus TaxID=2932254 RepID=A0ABY4GFW9_9BACT|nr:hypothetical protein [Hymenobacter volaticus]UOQ69379.1 hypothetical protein MUN86_27185 [Hymenobacter volaticus]